MSGKRIVSVILTAALTVFVFCLCFYFTGNALNRLPGVTQMNYNLAYDGSPLQIKEMESLSERISMKMVSFCSELDETSVKEETVTPVLTNDKYFEIYSIELDGGGITEEMLEGREKAAVIGSNLALKLFFNTDAVGKTVTLNGENYTVCGVYEESDAFINRISGDGKERVYIPYTCYEGYESCEMDVIAFDNKSPSAAFFEYMGLNQYHSSNLSESSKVIDDFRCAVYLLMFIFLCVFAIKIWYRLCGKFISEFRENLKTNYFFKSVKAMPAKYILFIITALGIPALLVFIFFVSDFGLFIPSKYLPYDNIFEISYYIEKIVQNANTVNSLALTGDAYLMNLYSNTFDILVWLTILFAMVLAVLAYNVNYFVKKIK